MKFLVDMALSPELARWLRSLGHDAVHAQELALAQAPDTTILSAANDQDRVIVTADLDFPRLLAIIRSTGPGVILLRGGNYSQAESLLCVQRVLMQVNLEDLPNSIIVMDKQKLRRRRLPLTSEEP